MLNIAVKSPEAEIHPNHFGRSSPKSLMFEAAHVGAVRQNRADYRLEKRQRGIRSLPSLDLFGGEIRILR